MNFERRFETSLARGPLPRNERMLRRNQMDDQDFMLIASAIVPMIQSHYEQLRKAA